MKQKNAILLNDTSGESHVGCSQVITNIRLVCEANSIHITRTFTRQQIVKDPRFSVVAHASDLIIVNGEGSLHHSPECTESLLGISSKVPKILINSVWEKMYCCEDLLRNFFQISVRESRSFQEMKEIVSMDKVRIVPDMIFYSTGALEPQKLGYSDCVMPFVSSTLRKRSNYFPLQTEASSPDIHAYIAWLKSLDLYVTGRFHGVCLAMMLGIPFLAIPSNSFKIEGLLEDCNCTELMIRGLSEVEKKRGEAMQAVEKTLKYSSLAKGRIVDFFKRVRCMLDGE